MVRRASHRMKQPIWSLGAATVLLAGTAVLYAAPRGKSGTNDQEKEAAARASLQFVKDGQVVGLGTGSTAAYFIKLLGEQVKNGLRVRGIPTSVRSRELAESLGIPLTTLDECQEIAVTVDGGREAHRRDVDAARCK